MLLFINACVRKDSRTKLLTDRLLALKGQPVCELRLEDVVFPAVDEEYIEARESLIREKRFDAPMFELARQFAEADEIVIAAPFWDLSFPAALKQYFEIISVRGVTFTYSPEGVPAGLCKAKRITYVTTAGGNFFPGEFGFGYVKALAESFYGIRESVLVKATGLDLIGADVDKILEEAASTLPEE